MKIIDRSTWKRAKHFEYFRNLDMPHFQITANVDITQFRKWIKKEDYPFFLSMAYVTSRVANEIDEFRYRIRGEDVIVHDVVHPSYTIMTIEGVYDYLHAPYFTNLDEFISVASELTKEAQKEVTLEDGVGRDDVLYFTSVPWISFTSIMHPIHLSPVDSIPRIAWGKFFEQGDKILIPVSIQAHHALMDGEHAGRYFIRLQNMLDNMDLFVKKDQ